MARPGRRQADGARTAALMEIFIAIAITLGLVMVFFGISYLTHQEDAIGSRLDRYAGRDQAGPAEPRPAPSGGGQSALTAAIERSVTKQSFATQLRAELNRADLKLTASEFILLRCSVTFLLGLFLLVISGFNVFFLAGGLFIGWKIPGIWLGRRQNARLKAFSDQMGDTISMLTNGLRSGYSVLQAMQMVAAEAPEPTATEYQRVVREIGLGRSPEEALANLVRRIRSDDLDMMVTAMNVQREVGGNLSQVLETIGNTIRERIRIKGEIGSLTAQQAVSAYVMAGLPLALSGVLYLINKNYMLEMFRFPYLVLPGCALLSIGIGFVVIKKIVDIKV